MDFYLEENVILGKTASSVILIPAPRRLRQEDFCEFKGSLGLIAIVCLRGRRKG